MQADPIAPRRTCLTAALAGMASLLAACASPSTGETDAERQGRALRGLGFRPTDEGWEFSLNGKLLFESDSDALDAESQRTAERLGRELARLGLQKVRVEGHTDSQGSLAYNHALSLRRALAVANTLEAAGLRARIETVGLGKAAPVNDNRTPEQRQQNRRVAVVIPAQ